MTLSTRILTLLLPMAFVATGCGNDLSKICNNADDGIFAAGEHDSCEENLAALEEECPNAYAAMIACMLEADGSTEIGRCAGACVDEQLAAPE